MPDSIGQFFRLLTVLLITRGGNLPHTRLNDFLHFRLSVLHQRQALKGLADDRPQVALRPQECLHELDVMTQGLRHRLVAKSRLEYIL